MFPSRVLGEGLRACYCTHSSKTKQNQPPRGTSPDPADSSPCTPIERGRNHAHNPAARRRQQNSPGQTRHRMVPVTVDEAKTAQLSVGTSIGGTVILVGLLGIVGALASSFSRPPATTIHGEVLFLSSLCVISGLVVCAASHVTGRNATLTRELADHVDVKSADLTTQVEQLTTQVEASNYIVRQLSAAPTVRLHEVRQALDETLARVVEAAKVEAVHEIGTRVDGVHLKLEELWARSKDLEADLASFRLWQKQLAPTATANGKAIALRSVPKQQD